MINEEITTFSSSNLINGKNKSSNVTGLKKKKSKRKPRSQATLVSSSFTRNPDGNMEMIYSSSMVMDDPPDEETLLSSLSNHPYLRGTGGRNAGNSITSSLEGLLPPEFRTTSSFGSSTAGERAESANSIAGESNSSSSSSSSSGSVSSGDSSSSIGGGERTVEGEEEDQSLLSPKSGAGETTLTSVNTAVTGDSYDESTIEDEILGEKSIASLAPSSLPEDTIKEEDDEDDIEEEEGESEYDGRSSSSPAGKFMKLGHGDEEEEGEGSALLVTKTAREKGEGSITEAGNSGSNSNNNSTINEQDENVSSLGMKDDKSFLFTSTIDSNESSAAATLQQPSLLLTDKSETGEGDGENDVRSLLTMDDESKMEIEQRVESKEDDDEEEEDKEKELEKLRSDGLEKEEEGDDKETGELSPLSTDLKSLSGKGKSRNHKKKSAFSREMITELCFNIIKLVQNDIVPDLLYSVFNNLAMTFISVRPPYLLRCLLFHFIFTRPFIDGKI
jgi:hypothetical protein